MIKFPKVVAAKLTREEYELCQEVAREYYHIRYIKAPTNSELIRFALNEIFEKYRSNRTSKHLLKKEKTGNTKRSKMAPDKRSKSKKTISALVEIPMSPYFLKLFDEFGQGFSEIPYHEFYHLLL
jgi:hypothetical protein